MPRRSDPLTVVESAYRLDIPEDAWTEGLRRAIEPFLDDGHGVMAFVADVGDTSGPMLRSPAAGGGSREWQETWRSGWWERVALTLPRDVLTAMLTFTPVAYASQVGEALAQRLEVFEEYVAAVRASGMHHVFGRVLHPDGAQPEPGLSFAESFAIIATEASGHSVMLCGNRGTIAQRVPSRAMIARWGRVAAHLSAAHRMRRRLADNRALDNAEAIFAPGGRLVHAEGPAKERDAREVLREAAIAIDRARASGVRDTDEALDLWRALQQGRWSMVDEFDRDGRRFIVARENEPAANVAPSLSKREQQVVDLLALGHSNKLIAYDLGISTSSVATHLRRAADKLGLRTTRELVRWARARRRARA